jgi:hypothetical protein
VTCVAGAEDHVEYKQLQYAAWNELQPRNTCFLAVDPMVGSHFLPAKALPVEPDVISGIFSNIGMLN